MAFGKQASVVAVDIGDMQIGLFDPKPTSSQAQKATVDVQVIMSDGRIEVRQFNLVDHVSAGTITQLQTLAATLRTKAVAEILP